MPVVSLANIPRTELLAALLSVGVGVALLVVKFIAYALTGSAAIFSDALESIVNVLASSAALYALMVAHAPADREHPYGHGKIEFMSAGFEGGMILVAALVILFQAALVVYRGLDLRTEQLNTGLWLMAGAMVINGGVGLILLRVGRGRCSLALEADGKHLLTDAITSIGALAALGVVRLTGWQWADPIGAVMIGLYIGWMGIGLLEASAAGLMDKQDARDQRMLREILDAHVGPTGREPRICSYHKLRHRHSGRYHWVDFHIMVPPELSVAEGHRIASSIEYEIELALGEGNATAHVEPCAECEKPVASSQ